jgi:hypothetical protein
MLISDNNSYPLLESSTWTCRWNKIIFWISFSPSIKKKRKDKSVILIVRRNHIWQFNSSQVTRLVSQDRVNEQYTKQSFLFWSKSVTSYSSSIWEDNKQISNPRFLNDREISPFF